MQGDTGESDDTPILWHLKVSNYNEKARWALDYKGIPHIRRAEVPGQHAKLARRLTGESTFPVLVLDGEAIGDSTRIIEALERRWRAVDSNADVPSCSTADQGASRSELLFNLAGCNWHVHARQAVSYGYHRQVVSFRAGDQWCA
jgi:glutaredoxin